MFIIVEERCGAVVGCDRQCEEGVVITRQCGTVSGGSWGSIASAYYCCWEQWIYCDSWADYYYRYVWIYRVWGGDGSVSKFGFIGCLGMDYK